MKKLLALAAIAIACSATLASAQHGGRHDGRFDQGRQDHGRQDHGRFDQGRSNHGRFDHGRHDRWRIDIHPYAERHHFTCQDKARRLWAFERRATSDHRLSFWERRELAALQRDLDRTCGRFRWRG